jgi:hypothetical protein
MPSPLLQAHAHAHETSEYQADLTTIAFNKFDDDFHTNEVRIPLRTL